MTNDDLNKILFFLKQHNNGGCVSEILSIKCDNPIVDEIEKVLLNNNLVIEFSLASFGDCDSKILKITQPGIDFINEGGFKKITTQPLGFKVR